MSTESECPSLQVTASNILYYPYMNAPSIGNSWFTRVLLYWDKVYLIVPDVMQEHLNEYTYSLTDEGLVHFVAPYQFLLDQPSKIFSISSIYLKWCLPKMNECEYIMKKCTRRYSGSSKLKGLLEECLKTEKSPNEAD